MEPFFWGLVTNVLTFGYAQIGVGHTKKSGWRRAVKTRPPDPFASKMQNSDDVAAVDTSDRKDRSDRADRNDYS